MVWLKLSGWPIEPAEGPRETGLSPFNNEHRRIYHKAETG